MSPPASPFDVSSRRLAVYGYLAPLVSGRRIVEIGCGDGAGAARLQALGATAVIAFDADAQVVSRARAAQRSAGVDFRLLDRRALDSGGAASGGAGADLVVVPEGAAFLRAGAAIGPAALKTLGGPDAQLAVLVESSDHPGARGGAGYYEIVDALERVYGRVRMFGLTPFAAFGLAEFSEASSGLRIDGGLVEDAGEQPTHYLALAGPDDDTDLGYALMQIPAARAGTAAAPEVRAAAPTEDTSELRRRLAEADGKAEGLLRVSRAQTEEIEELRARLRRSAEAREELDQEVARLRRALTEADTSVLDLTRRTTQEMASLAQRITAGLRPGAGDGSGDEGAVARLREELRRREEELAATESALSERDERVAALEAEKQDLDWRLAAALAAAPAPITEVARPVDDGAAQRQRELALEQYRQAAAAHLDEVGRLREALAEQSTLVAELEDALSVSGKRLQTALDESERLRRHIAEVEEADRARRSRLAEVEGTLLRLQRQTAMAASAARTDDSVAADAAWERKLVAARQDADRRVAEAEERAAAVRRAAELRAGEAERRVAELDGRVRELEAAVGSAGVNELTEARLEAALNEVSRLREALERSEEQLWETKGQLLLDRERMAVLEHQLATAPTEPIVTEAAHQSIMNAVYKELTTLETGVRAEVERIERVEKTLENAREREVVAAPEPTAANGKRS